MKTITAASFAELFHHAVTRRVARQRGIRIFIFLLAITLGFVPAGIEAAGLPVFAPRQLVLQLESGGAGGVFVVAAADFTGDGLLDVVLARGVFQTNTVHPLAILANDGTGHYFDATATIFIGPPPVVQHPREMVIADFNGDGRPDIFIADHGQDVSPFPGFQNQLALSTPDGRLINATANLPQQFDYTHSVAAGDIDGDGDLDLFIGNLGAAGGGPQLWLNDGTGHFTVGAGRLPPLNQNCPTVSSLCNRYTTALFVDVDGDGDLDLVLGGEQHTESAVLLNDGTGHFTFHPKAAAMPPKPFSAESQAIALDIQSSDLNGDGFADLVVSYTKNVPFYQGRWIQILINNGDGTFRDETATRLPQTDNNDDWIKFLEFRDLNGDGYLDLASRFVEGTSNSPLFFLNDGNGVFTPLPPGFGNIPNNLYLFLDADGDGGRDIFTTIPEFGSPCCPTERHFVVRDTSPVIAPATPTDVSASHGLFANKVRLTWSYVWGSTSYEVWRSSSPGSVGTLIGTTPLTTFDDASAPQGLRMYYSIRAVNGAGTSANSPQVPLAKATLVAGKLPGDFDADGKTDVGIYRHGTWYILRSLDSGVIAIKFGGLPQDTPVPADYDGDGKKDVAVYRDGAWWILRSRDGGVATIGWGGLLTDVPVPADYDGDGKADIAVYRDGIWFILRSSDGGQTTVGWGGLPQDIPVPADYDGDGKTDIAVYRDGNWFIRRSSDGGITFVGWGGLTQDVPVPADYDGDGKVDIAVYRDGNWFIRRSSDGGITFVGWGGLPQDVPVPGDYDGDRKTDIAVYRDGTWFIKRSSDGGVTTVGWGGLAQDIPLN